MTDFNVDRQGRQRQYVSIQKHHYTSRNSKANKWESRSKEEQTFDSADYGNLTKQPAHQSWEDHCTNLWGFINNFEYVGTNREQFGYFPTTQNLQDRWHGYPVIPFKKGYEIPRALIERWVNQELLNPDDIPNLINGKKIG